MLKRILYTACAVLLAYLTLMLIVLRAEISEATKEAKCAITACEVLSEAELPGHVVKSLLRINVHRYVESHVGDYRMMLLRKTYTRADLKAEVLDASLFNQIKSGSLELQTVTQVEALSMVVLSEYKTIAIFSESHRRLDIIPIESIKQAWPDDVVNLLGRSGSAKLEDFSTWETLRGYGRKFFWITEYKRISLACCDGKGGDGALSKEWFNENSATNIDEASARVLAVSRYGNILVRGDEQDFSYIWH